MSGYKFKVELDGGRIEEVTVLSSFYRDVAAALPALLAKSLPFDAKVWGDGTPEKWISSRIQENRFGQLVVSSIGAA